MEAYSIKPLDFQIEHARSKTALAKEPKSKFLDKIIEEDE